MPLLFWEPPRSRAHKKKVFHFLKDYSEFMIMMRYFFSRPCARVLTCSQENVFLWDSVFPTDLVSGTEEHTLCKPGKHVRYIQFFIFSHYTHSFFFFMILISSSHMLTHILRVTKRNKTMEVSFARRRSLSVSLRLSLYLQLIKTYVKRLKFRWFESTWTRKIFHQSFGWWFENSDRVFGRFGRFGRRRGRGKEFKQWKS